MRTVPRPRHRVGWPVVVLLSPLFRLSVTRDAYVLRVIGNRHGPVLVRRARAAPALRRPA